MIAIQYSMHDEESHLDLLTDLFLNYVRSEDYITLSPENRNRVIDTYYELKMLTKWVLVFKLEKEKGIYGNLP